MKIIKKSNVVIIYINFLLLFIPASAEQNDRNYKNVLFKMKQRFKEIKTYQCAYEMLTAKGEKIEKVVCRYFFKSPDMVRMELLEGKYKGAVMLYKSQKVRLKLRRGILSLFSLSYRPGHRCVTNLRGYGLHQSYWGWYIDRHINMLELTEGIFSGEETLSGRDTIKYKLISKNPGKTKGVAQEVLWIDKKELIPLKFVQYNSEGEILMFAWYKDIELNVALNDRIFKKFR